MKKRGIFTMAIKTVEQLKRTYPNLVNELVQEVKAKAVKEERIRLRGLDELGSVVSEDKLYKAKYVEPISPKDLALCAMTSKR